jgi:poly(hydroxyalkanoate) granule-associated protein
MVKKAKISTKSDDKLLAEAIRGSAHQIWQAGLGAFAKAQEEGGKVFAKLVKDGTDLQKRTQKRAEDKVGDVTDSVTKIAGSVSKQAADSWDKLEQVFEDRVSRALARLGVPTMKDIQALTARVEELNKMVKTPPAKKLAASAKKPPAKNAVRKAPAKKTAAKPSTKTATGKAPAVSAAKKSAATKTKPNSSAR